jgi:hypothetical protein
MSMQHQIPPTPAEAFSAIALLRDYHQPVHGLIPTRDGGHGIEIFSTHSRCSGWMSVVGPADFDANSQLGYVHQGSVAVAGHGSRSAGGFVFLFDAQRLPSCSVASDDAVFQALVQRWHKERGASSSITQIAMCRSYQRIIGMGDKAIPLILRDLAQNADQPDHWFWALQMLTGIDPVADEDRGDMRAMAATWLEWGKLSGYAR